MTGVSRNSVSNYIKSYIALGSKLEEILELTDRELEELFHPAKPSTSKTPTLNHPNWNDIHEELSKKGMRQVHYSGDKLFIDYSGLTMPITDQVTGEI